LQTKTRTSLTAKQFHGEIAYAMIVAEWRRKSFGRTKVAWHREFDVRERSHLNRTYRRLRTWALVTGLPDKLTMSHSTLRLLKRAERFFAVN